MHRFLSALLLLLSIPSKLHACSIDPFTWEQLALFADFAGSVTCTSGGRWISEYKIDESWKGIPVGTSFTAYTPGIERFDGVPVTVAGEKFAVFAFKATLRDDTLLSRVNGSKKGTAGFAQYMFPLYQGKTKLAPEGGTANLEQLGSKLESLDEFRHAVTKFLSLPPEKQELAALQSLARKYVPSRAEYEASIHREKASARDVTGILRKTDACASVQEFLETLFAMSLQLPEYSLREIVDGGYTETLRYLRENESYGEPFAANNPASVRILRIRTGEITFLDEQ